MQIHRIKSGANQYTDKLKQLADPPKQISSLGVDLSEQLKYKTLGIVGSRKVSAYGRSVTKKFADAAARAGLCIVSGLALGVDSIAHKAAIDAKGRTIAVMPSGLKNIYPASHRGLAKSILEQNGTLISEYNDDFKPYQMSFIERNRIIAALSDALLITEAAERSGSLHTANFALELGKPVLAVPGNIDSPTSTGTNNLIRTGAIIVSSEQDIFDVLGIDITKQTSLEIYGDNAEESLLIKLLSDGIMSGEELHSKSELSIADFQQTLTMLEIKGVIAPQGNNTWKLK